MQSCITKLSSRYHPAEMNVAESTPLLHKSHVKTCERRLTVLPSNFETASQSTVHQRQPACGWGFWTQEWVAGCPSDGVDRQPLQSCALEPKLLHINTRHKWHETSVHRSENRNRSKSTFTWNNINTRLTFRRVVTSARVTLKVNGAKGQCVLVPVAEVKSPFLTTAAMTHTPDYTAQQFAHNLTVPPVGGSSA